MAEKIAIYAGSFDPPTLGHLWMIERAASIFDKLIVAIGTNPKKQCLFTENDRLDMLYLSTQNISNISIRSFSYQFLVKYAKSVGAQTIIRGLRSSKDYEDEAEMCNINTDLDPQITTLFLMPPRELREVSSSMVKGLVGPDGWEEVVSNYVSLPVLERLKTLYRANIQ
ncbi:MAG TPA: pantetheine-phosphate adenylyltransferase [Candidatus Woesebacteria bacterium]|nr:pantetheine-phosphate adenylyltransferase [Candidatus Woesebacteria bacterium]